MAARKVLTEDLIRFWPASGIALCPEAQADGVPCPVAGRSCETCERAFGAFLAMHPDWNAGNSNGRREPPPESTP